MSHYLDTIDADGRPFSHTFNNSDWSEICSLCGQREASVELSQGSASISYGDVTISLNFGSGIRHYSFKADDLFS